ncbi:MAG: hypothetical protein K2H82_02045, partial [Oscillospiraceae bacterium]|nr:hypothetical protein [Oscillospiraceae bacterium]
MQNQENYQEKNQKHAFQVNLGGMIDILSNHLYSSPDVFVRELLQNGTDAISARKYAEERSCKRAVVVGGGFI